jgi:Transmembrane family 220, helix
LLGRLRWPFSALVGAVALIWALSISPHVIGKTTFADMFQSFHMINEVVEEAREMGGLLIVALWMAVLTLVSCRSRTPRLN